MTERLNEEYGLGDLVTVDEGPGGMPRVQLMHPSGRRAAAAGVNPQTGTRRMRGAPGLLATVRDSQCVVGWVAGRRRLHRRRPGCRPILSLATPYAPLARSSARLYLLGANVTSWCLPNGSDVLYILEDATFDGSTPIKCALSR